MELLLERYRNKHSTDVDNRVGLVLNQNSKLIHNDVVSETIDQFQQYMMEKDKSNKYRFTFTIMPVCSNVLFNAITEVVYDEGHASHCRFFGINGRSSDLYNVELYHTYKGLAIDKTITRHDAIEDTSYSHNRIGPFVYHCGFDIFNNHTLRAKEFTVINKLGNTNKTNFNTIKDYIRDRNGYQVKDYLIGLNVGSMTAQSLLRLYSYDTIRSFSDSITNNLIEKDGWFGFSNPCSIDTLNVRLGTDSFSVNKCMNNNKACEFIDMYPDRSLYSFIPKVNKLQERIEPNWEYCLTYPYSVHYNDVVQNDSTKTNGLKCKMVSLLSDVNYYESDTQITFRTDIKHNLSYGDIIGITIISNGSANKILNTITVSAIGLDGYDGNYYFSVKYDSIEEYFDELGNPENEIRVCKIINGQDCKYYFRVFKRIPNFKDTDVYADDEVTYSEIASHCLDGFDSSINKMAFERSIYNDNVVQIVFNDDVDLTGLRDNLGREVSEIFLTLVKCNDGYKAWYQNKRYSGTDITFSHCFGKLTAGLDCPGYVDNYNVHKIHNVRISGTDSQAELKKNVLRKHLNLDVDKAVKNLEEEKGEITIKGDTFFKGNGEFLGDIVEFSPYEFEERVIEDVYFRFNTAQREDTNFGVYGTSVSGEYANLEYDEINYDDYDSIFNGSSDKSDAKFLTRKKFNEVSLYNEKNVLVGTESYPANVFPEGYYYKPHYRMKVREYEDSVNVGAHTMVEYESDYETEIENCDGYNRIRIKTAKNYFFNVNDKVYLYHKSKDRGKDITTTVYSVEGDNFEYITLNVPSSFTTFEKMAEYRVYRHNVEKPKYARELNDGTGRYIWRMLKKEINIMTDSELYNSVFMNGAHYHHKNINFFLRRQDPVCEYGLSYCDGVNSRVLKLVIDGKQKDVTPYEFVESDENVIC